jgi:hypothetical protein
MKIDTLLHALEYYLLSADCHEANECDSILDAIAECHELAEHFDDLDTSSEIVHVVSSSFLRDMFVKATYDIYCEQAKRFNGEVPFRVYAHEVRYSSIEHVTNRLAYIGYDFARDLWLVNKDND